MAGSSSWKLNTQMCAKFCSFRLLGVVSKCLDIPLSAKRHLKFQNYNKSEIQNIQGTEEISSVAGILLKDLEFWSLWISDVLACSWRPLSWPEYVWSACSTSLPLTPLHCRLRAHTMILLENHENHRRIGGGAYACIIMCICIYRYF